MEFDAGIVGIKTAKIDVDEVDGVLDEEEEASAAVPGAIAPDHSEALETWVTRRWIEFCLLNRSDDDVLFLHEVVYFRRGRPNAVGVELKDFGAWRLMRTRTRARTRVRMDGSADEE